METPDYMVGRVYFKQFGAERVNEARFNTLIRIYIYCTLFKTFPWCNTEVTEYVVNKELL